MLRKLSTLAIASLTTACLSDPGIPEMEQQEQALSLNAKDKSATERVKDAFRGFLNQGVVGARVKRVGGSVSVSLNDQHVFDPASALKVAHFTYALGTEFGLLNAPFAFTYPQDPQNPNVPTPCPDNTWLANTNDVNTSIANGLNMMMQNSDNRVTRAFEDRYTRANLNDMMSAIGMPNSELRQYIGCGYDNGQRNRTTARDLTRLYERVAAGAILPVAQRAAFFNITTQNLPNRVRQVIVQEAAKLGKGDPFVNDFTSKTSLHSKGGSYNICPQFGGCGNTYEYVRSQAGILTLPIKPECNDGPKKVLFAPPTAERHIAFARYITALQIPCTPQGTNEPLNAAEARCPLSKAANDAMNAAEVEMFRSEIREAIMTFEAPCTPAPTPPGRGRAPRTPPGPTAPPPGIDPDEIDFDGDSRGDIEDHDLVVQDQLTQKAANQRRLTVSRRAVNLGHHRLAPARERKRITKLPELFGATHEDTGERLPGG